MVIRISIDSCVEEEHDTISEAEGLNKINASGIPPHRLASKPGACIILIKNLNISHGHCNGTRYIIKELTPRLQFPVLLAYYLTLNRAQGQSFE